MKNKRKKGGKKAKQEALHGSRSIFAIVAFMRSGAGIHKGQGGYKRKPKHPKNDIED